jgi:predicted nuclease with TOPRIM domain
MLQTSLNTAVIEFRAELDEIAKLNDELNDDKHNLNQTLNEVENSLEIKNEQIGDLQKEKFDLSGNLAALEQLLFVKEDSHNMVEDLVNQNEMYRSIKE